MDINDLRQKRAALVTEARQVLERQEQEKRSMTAEEDQHYERIMAEVDRLATVIEREETLRRVEAGLDEPGKDGPRPEPQPHPGERKNPRETEEYRALFGRFLRGGMEAVSQAEMRALQADSDPAGGFTVAPQLFVARLIEKLKDLVFVRNLATTFDVANADSLGAPAMANDIEDSTWQGEIATIDRDTALQFEKRELKPHASAKEIQVSNKLLRVASIDIEALIREQLSYKFGITEEKAFLTGTGSQQPLGLFTASGQGISTSRDMATGNSTTDIGADGLIEAKYNQKAQYQARAVWIFHRDAIKRIRKLKDGNGDYLWRAGISTDRPDTILERPFFMSEYAPNTFTTGLYVGLFGDLSFYWIATALNMQIQRVDQLYARTRQTGFIGDMEVDGMPVLEEAFTRVKLA